MSDNKYFVGADIGGTSVKIGLFCNNNEEWTDKWEIPSERDNNGENILPDISVSLKEACIRNSIAYNDICGIGIGVPGPVFNDGTVNKCANLGWGVINVKNIMKELTGIENIVAANDANVAALGEQWRGGGKEFSNLVMVTLGTGVGGGIIIDGRIYSGSLGAAGEIGHIKVNPDENAVCGCGCRGCLEQYSSATGIVRLYKMIMKDSASNDITAKDIFDMAKEGNEPALTVIDTAMKYLGMALANVAAAIDPQAFVIGGGVSKAGSIITDMVSRYYNMYSMGPLKNRKFRLAGLGNDAGIYGCVRLAMDNYKTVEQ